MGLIGKPIITSTAAPSICMLARLSSVDRGIGGVGMNKGKNKDRTRTTKDIVTKMRAGLRTVLARIRNKMLAPAQKIMLKMTTSVAGSGLTSGGGNSSGAINSMPTKSSR